jgi:uncharacterized coiled-coil protein SlyX
VRAFRARQRGEDEPPTIEEVIDDGGEVAARWTQLEELHRTVAEQNKTISSLESEIAMLEQRLEDERERYARIDEENERLRSELRRRPKRRSDTPGAATDHSQLAPNRAARRRSQRERGR